MTTIVVPFDGSAACDYALDVACASASRGGDEVRAVYIIRVPSQLPIDDDLPDDRVAAECALARSEAIAERHGALLTTVVAVARAAGPAIVEAAQECDCIMIGCRAQRRYFERIVFDRTLRYVMAHAPCQVLVCYLPSVAARAAGTQQFLLTPLVVPQHPFHSS